MRFEALDAFRGLCALCVVLFHFRVFGTLTEINFFRYSSIFVEFFFVLSGFVLAHSYAFKENLNFKTYFKSRFFRIYPLHFFMLLVFILLEFSKLIAYKLFNISFGVPPFTGEKSIYELIPNLTLTHAWTFFTNPLSFNYPSWSISIEFYMYLILFATIYFFKKIKYISWLLLTVTAFYFMFNKNSIFTISAFNGIACFFGGCLTYVFFKNSPNLKLNIWISTFLEISLSSLSLNSKKL